MARTSLAICLRRLTGTGWHISPLVAKIRYEPGVITVSNVMKGGAVGGNNSGLAHRSRHREGTRSGCGCDKFDVAVTWDE